MMRTMRSMAKWIMGVVAVTFVGFMIFEVGMDASGRGGAGAQTVVARVNGVNVSYTEFQTALRNEQERLRQEQGAVPYGLEEQQAFEDQVLEQIIQSILLQQEYARRGIRVTDEEILAAVQSSPPPEVFDLPQFQTDGQFDPQKYQRFIASAADPQFLMALEARYRDEIPRYKLFQQLTAGVFPSDAQLWRAWRDQHDSVVATLLPLIPARVVPDGDVSVSDQEVEAYYRAHREDFDRPALAYLSYVSVSRRPTPEDTAAAAERAREIRAELAGGADFAAVARRESSDSVSAAQGGDLGDVPWGSFVAPFEEAVRGLRPGQLSQPVRTRFGWHIIQVEARTDSTFHARHVLIPIAPAGRRLETIEAKADTLDLFAAEQDNPQALDQVAADLGLTVRKVDPLLEGFRASIGDDIVGDAGVWAFGTAEVGTTSPVVETPLAYYVFRLDSLRPAGVPPLNQIREDVRQAALAAKQQEATRTLAREIAGEIGGSRTLEAIAAARGLETLTVGPFTRVVPAPALRGAPEVVGAAFGAGVGQVVGPIHTDQASYFIRPDRKILADSAAWRAQLDTQRREVLQQLQADRLRLIMASLRRNAKVEDLRLELERAQREAERQNLPQSPLGF